MIPYEFWLTEFLTILDDVAVCSSSKWDLVWFSKQWPELFKNGRVLSWKTVEGLIFLEWDITILDDVAVCSYTKWDPAWFSEQWPELFEIGRVQSCQRLCSDFNTFISFVLSMHLPRQANQGWDPFCWKHWSSRCQSRGGSGNFHHDASSVCMEHSSLNLSWRSITYWFTTFLNHLKIIDTENTHYVVIV